MITRFFILLIIAYFFYAIFMFFYQRRVLFPGSFISEVPEVSSENEYEIIFLNCGETKYPAFFIPAAGIGESKAPCLIYAHGNNEFSWQWIDKLMPYVESGINVIIPEYPGFSGAPGRTSKKSIMQVFRAAYEYVCGDARVDKDNIILHGRSLGGGVVSELSRESSVKGVILESTFTSNKAFTGNYLLPSFLLRDVFSPLDALRDREVNVLIFHGKRDRVVPYSHALDLHTGISGALLIDFDSGHNDLFKSDPEKYWKSILSCVLEWTGK